MRNSFRLFSLFVLFSLFQPETLALPPVVHRCGVLDTLVLVAKTSAAYETPDKNPKAKKALKNAENDEFKEFNI